MPCKSNEFSYSLFLKLLRISPPNCSHALKNMLRTISGAFFRPPVMNALTKLVFEPR